MVIILEKLVTTFERVGRLEARVKVEDFCLDKKCLEQNKD